MTTYAKLTPEGQLNVLRYIPHVACPSEERMAAYATEHGYKPASQYPAPGIYYTESWSETPDTIQNNWTPIQLEQAKEDALQRVQEKLTSTLSTRTIIDCPGFSAGIIYDGDALTNASGLEPGDNYIDAANNVTILTEEALKAIRVALKQYRLDLYAKATVTRALIDAAKNVDEVEAAITNAE